MIRIILPLCLFGNLLVAPLAVAGPEEDRMAMVKYYTERFPDTPLQEFANGLYAFDEDAREQWLEMEDFPLYEIAVEDGQALFETNFANGKSYADCFENGGIGVRQNYPYFDSEAGEVITLELAINQCRISNGEKPLKYKTGKLAELSAYMASTSRGKTFDVKVPNEAAYDAYMGGKKFYYAKRGQLNLACVDCHLTITGQKLRADIPQLQPVKDDINKVFPLRSDRAVVFIESLAPNMWC